MRSKTLGTLGLFAVLAACASVSTQRDTDREAVRQLLQERTGADPGAAGSDEGALAPEVRALFANPLTEDSAVKVALLNNREVRAHFAALGVASADLVQAGLLANPVLALDARFFSDGTELEIGIVESLFDIFFVAARERVAASELEATKARIAREIVRLVYDVRRAFNRARAAQELVEAANERARAAQASADLMGELHRAGNVTDPQLSAELLALSQAKLGVAQAAAAAADARAGLQLELGLSGEELAWSLDASVPPEPGVVSAPEELEQRAILASLDLAELRAEATAEARRAGIVDWEAVLAPGSVGLTAKREAGSSDWGVGPSLGFSLPVFDSGSARRAALEARLEQARARHIALEVQVRSAARRLGRRLAALREQAAMLHDEALPLAERLVRETLRNYNAMQIGVFEVLEAKQAANDLAREYLETLRDAADARLDLEELLAGSLDPERLAGDLASPRNSLQGAH